MAGPEASFNSEPSLPTPADDGNDIWAWTDPQIFQPVPILIEVDGVDGLDLPSLSLAVDPDSHLLEGSLSLNQLGMASQSVGNPPQMSLSLRSLRGGLDEQWNLDVDDLSLAMEIDHYDDEITFDPTVVCVARLEGPVNAPLLHAAGLAASPFRATGAAAAAVIASPQAQMPVAPLPLTLPAAAPRPAVAEVTELEVACAPHFGPSPRSRGEGRGRPPPKRARAVLSKDGTEEDEEEKEQGALMIRKEKGKDLGGPRTRLQARSMAVTVPPSRPSPSTSKPSQRHPVALYSSRVDWEKRGPPVAVDRVPVEGKRADEGSTTDLEQLHTPRPSPGPRVRSVRIRDRVHVFNDESAAGTPGQPVQSLNSPSSPPVAFPHPPPFEPPPVVQVESDVPGRTPPLPPRPPLHAQASPGVPEPNRPAARPVQAPVAPPPAATQGKSRLHTGPTSFQDLQLPPFLSPGHQAHGPAPSALDFLSAPPNDRADRELELTTFVGDGLRCGLNVNPNWRPSHFPDGCDARALEGALSRLRGQLLRERTLEAGLLVDLADAFVLGLQRIGAGIEFESEDGKGGGDRGEGGRARAVNRLMLGNVERVLRFRKVL